jgi:magnesium-protoporphyrin IX monomethyl ester (oxidative) cyclase
MSIPWECESRVDTLTKPLIEKMVQAGCKAMWFGIESGSPRILKTIKKGITPEQTKNVFRWCREVGIETGAALMVGFPSETLDDVRMTRDLALELEAKMYSIATYVGFPKSEMYAYALENDLCEARHGDLSIVRNEHFSFTELVDLEREIAYAVRPLGRDLTEFARWFRRGIWGFLWKGQRVQRLWNGLVYLKNLKRRISENRSLTRRLTG